jgi:hypothetical protein
MEFLDESRECISRQGAFQCLSLAECMNNPEERAEMLRFARLWMNLAEPIEEARGAYEWPAVVEAGMNLYVC